MQFLEALSFFKEFSPEEKQELVTTEGVFLRYKPGDSIIREGECEDAIFIILKGQVKITKKSLPDTHLSVLNPGALFGEIALISTRPRTTNAIATQETVVMRISQDLVDHFGLELAGKFQDQLIHILAKRLDDMNDKYIKALNDPMYQES